MLSDPRVAVLAIGNELLSGKVKDLNAWVAIERFRELGTDLAGIFTIPDDLEEIAFFVRILSPRYDALLTSGGIGPTHDDLTVAAVAKAFGRELTLNEDLARMIRQRWKGPINEAVLKMAEVPEGAELVKTPAHLFPVVRVENVYMLPGEPAFFSQKFCAIAERFRGRPFFDHRVNLKVSEPVVAAALARVEAEHVGVRVGSYPRYEEGKFRVQVILESREAGLLDRAVADLLSALPPDAVQEEVEEARGEERPSVQP